MNRESEVQTQISHSWRGSGMTNNKGRRFFASGPVYSASSFAVQAFDLTRHASRVTSHENKKERFPAASYSPTPRRGSTIGAGGLNCRVRHGSGCVTSAMATENLSLVAVIR